MKSCDREMENPDDRWMPETDPAQDEREEQAWDEYNEYMDDLAMAEQGDLVEGYAQDEPYNEFNETPW